MQVNKRELSEIVGKSEATLTAWSKQGMPIQLARTKGRSHVFDTAEVIEWMIQREVGSLSNDGNLDLTAERARLTFHQANNERLKEQQLRGSLIPAEIVVQYCAASVVAVRSKLLSLHSKIKNRFPDLPQEAIDEIQSFHHEALEELGHDGVPAEIRERIRDHIESVEATPESDDQRMG